MPRAIKHRLLAVLVLLIGVSMTAASSLPLIRAKQIHDEAMTAHHFLLEQVAIRPIPDLTMLADDALQTDSSVPTIEQRVDFAALHEISEDAVAWLYSPGTTLDYPIAKASDYSYYLCHLLDKSYNAYGTLFIDYNNAPDFSDALTVVYGHHTATGMMFATLDGYKNQSYYEQHPVMYLYTADAIYQVNLVYGCLVAVGQWRDRAFMYATNLNELLNYAAQNTTFTSTTSYQPGDNVIAMSTCAYEFDGARYVVIGTLQKVQ